MTMNPMQKARAIDRGETDIDALRDDLDTIRSALDRLIEKVDAAGSANYRRFSRYLDTLDRVHADVVEALDSVADGDGDVDLVATGVRDAWARLAIATTAADARFC